MARISFVLLVLLAACGGSDPGAPDSALPTGDAGPLPAAAVELGTGVDTFLPVIDGQTVALSRGNQRLQHVWVCLRASHLHAAAPFIRLSLTRPSDGAVVSDPYYTRLPFADKGSYQERVGMRLVVSNPAAVVGQDLVLGVTIEGGEGQTANAEVAVRVLWEEDLGGVTP